MISFEPQDFVISCKKVKDSLGGATDRVITHQSIFIPSPVLGDTPMGDTDRRLAAVNDIKGL